MLKFTSSPSQMRLLAKIAASADIIVLMVSIISMILGMKRKSSLLFLFGTVIGSLTACSFRKTPVIGIIGGADGPTTIFVSRPLFRKNKRKP